MKYVLKSQACQDMKYILKGSIEDDRNYYVYSDSLIHNKLNEAKIFNTLAELKAFRKQQAWTKSYIATKITKADLFKAKLADK